MDPIYLLALALCYVGSAAGILGLAAALYGIIELTHRLKWPWQ